NSWGWGSTSIVALLAGSVVMLVAFVLIERRVKAPIVEFPLFASRNFVGANLVALIVTFAMLAQFFFIALYMQDVLGLSPLATGVAILGAVVAVSLLRGRAERSPDLADAEAPVTAPGQLATAQR